jgi:hypothetical protein
VIYDVYCVNHGLRQEGLDCEAELKVFDHWMTLLSLAPSLLSLLDADTSWGLKSTRMGPLHADRFVEESLACS